MTPYVLQAWAFACAARKALGKAPAMCMNNYPMEVWLLHRKLVHHFIRYFKCFLKANSKLKDYRRAVLGGKSSSGSKSVSTSSPVCVICLLSESETSGDAEDAEDDDDAAREDTDASGAAEDAEDDDAEDSEDDDAEDAEDDDDDDTRATV